MRSMSLADVKAHLSAVVDQVLEGDEVVITRRGLPVARIVAEREALPCDSAALLEDLRANVMAQPQQGETGVDLVNSMRRGARY